VKINKQNQQTRTHYK